MTDTTTVPFDVTAAGEDEGNGSIPTRVRIEGAPRFTPNQMRRIAAATGRSIGQLMNDPADVMQAAIWMNLTAAGHNVTWAQAGDVECEFVPAADPFSPESATTEPRSAGSGG